MKKDKEKMYRKIISRLISANMDETDGKPSLRFGTWKIIRGDTKGTESVEEIWRWFEDEVYAISEKWEL